MSFPLKTRGLRRIVVGGTEFRWRIGTGTNDSGLIVYHSSSTRPLQVTLLGWQDLWLAFPTPTSNSPELLGPAFVHQAIDFALQNGWRYAERGAPFRAQWNGRVFSAPSH